MQVAKYIVTGIFLSGLATTPALALDCSTPPSGFGNAWWSEYADWCSSCGGTPDSSTTSCTPGSNWGGGDGSTGGGQGLYRTGDLLIDTELYLMEKTLPVFFDAIGQQLACEIDPNCPRKVRQRQIEEQQRLEREANQRAAEAERRRQELERRARFEQSKQNLLGEMRLQPGSGDLQPRNLALTVRESQGPLQVKTLAPRDLTTAPNLGAAALRSPLARASCGVFLLQKSNRAAADGDFQEAAFLSNEAAALISGEKITSSVACPPPPDVPEVGEGAPVRTDAYRQKSLEIQAALQKRSRFVKQMYQRVANQGERYREISEAVRVAEEQKLAAQARLVEARAAEAELKARLQSRLPQHTEPVATLLPDETPADPAAESAMAEALAALESAEAAYNEADNDVQSNLNLLAGVEIAMQETRSLFDEVKQDPTHLDQALKVLDRKEVAR